MRKLRRPEARRTPAVSIDRIAFGRISNCKWSVRGYGEDAGGASAQFACVRSLRRTKFDSRPYTASLRNDGMWGSISLGARLRHLAARLAHSGGCGIRHQPRVAENRAELVSLAETSNGRHGSIGMHARDLAALA